MGVFGGTCEKYACDKKIKYNSERWINILKFQNFQQQKVLETSDVCAEAALYSLFNLHLWY